MVAAISAVGIDDGAVRRGIDRYDELTCDGEKPLTTLVVLRSDEAESEVTDWAEGVNSELKEVSSVGCCVMTLSACGMVVSRGGEYVLMLRVMGSSSFFSLMVMTIFSRSSGVIWRSRPRLLLLTESFLRIRGCAMSRGADVDEEVLSLSNSSASSSASESRLPERLGTSVEYRPSEFLDAIEMAGVVAFASETGSQQNVSLFHNLQLKFSNRRPSSNDPEHLEKTDSS